MKNTISETKNTLEGTNSRFNEAECHISDFTDKVTEKTQSEQKKKKRISKNEDSLRDFWVHLPRGMGHTKAR